MNGMAIRTEVTENRPKYRTTAAELLAACREFYQNPENEAAYQAWTAERNQGEKKIR